MTVYRPLMGRNFPWLIILCLTALLFTSGFNTPIQRRQSTQVSSPPLLLPDLRTLPPADLRLVIDRKSGQKLIRFSNAVWNSGPGSLELRGELNHGEEFARVSQIIHREDGSLARMPAGQFYFHADHNHVHWEAFSLYQVWATHPDGRLDRLVASRDKVGYCIRDYTPHPQPGSVAGQDLPEDVTPIPNYTSCSWLRQGLSVGWSDVYKAHTSGQFVDVSHLPDGLYALKSSADPQNMLREAADTNNSALVYFVLRQDRLRVYLPEELFTRLRPAIGSLRWRFRQIELDIDWN